MQIFNLLLSALSLGRLPNTCIQQGPKFNSTVPNLLLYSRLRQKQCHSDLSTFGPSKVKMDVHVNIPHNCNLYLLSELHDKL